MRYFAWLLGLLSVAAFAQTNAGSITGTVFDPQKAIIGNARITAVNLATNVTRAATTTNAGAYTLPALEPGDYRVTAELEGFKKLVREPVKVESSGTTTLDLELEIGSTSTEVTVKADVPLIQASTSTLQYDVTLKQIDELPLANQSALQVLSLLPGVIGDPGNEQVAVTTGYIVPGGGMSISGGRMGTTQYQADGVNNTGIFFGRISLSFSTDAISEVTVQQNSYSAEFGRVGGGIVNMTTKSGTNRFHGTVFSFSQNDALNAGTYQNSFKKKNMIRYWRGGVDIGGPVLIPKLYNGRNRTFFFASYEPLRQYTQSTNFARVATDAERQGDFSHDVYDTAANQPIEIFQQYPINATGSGFLNKKLTEPANTAYPQFPNNIIPRQLISRIGQKILMLQPEPNMPLNSSGQNYVTPRSVRNTDNRYMYKVDQVITPANRLSFRFAEVPVKGVRTFIAGLPDWVPTETSTGTNIALSDTQTWGGNKVNDLRLGFNRYSFVRRENDLQLSQNYFQQYGFPSFLSAGFPTILMNSQNGVLDLGTDPSNSEIDNSYQLTDIMNWVKGKHSLKFGFETQVPQQNLTDLKYEGGTWSFSNSSTNIGAGNTAQVLGIPNAATGSNLASLLIGFPNSVNLAPYASSYQYRWKYFAGFLQDDFKVTPHLTLNIGIRYQVEVPRTEKHNMQGTFVDQMVTLSTGQQQEGYIQLDGRNGAPTTLWPTRYNNFEPRFGFAYRVPAWIKGLQVVRGAYAISHVPTTGLFRIASPDLSPKAAQLSANGAANGGQVQLDDFPLVPPASSFTIPADGKLTNISNINSIYYLNPHVTIPYMQQWNFGLAFQFGNDYALTATYVGSKGTNLFGPSAIFNAVNIDAYTQQYQSGLNMNDLFPNPAGITDATGKVIQVTRQNLLRPIPTVGDITDPLEQGYTSFYNALQLNFTRRFARGLMINVNYTWSKSTDNSSCDGQFCNDQVQNWGVSAPQLFGDNRRLEHSISLFDVPSVFRFNYNWNLPVGRGKSLLNHAPKWLDYIAGNWTVTGNGTAQSGLPLQAQLGATAGFPDDVGKIRVNVNPGAPTVMPGWRENLNNPITQRTPYINSLALFSPPALLTLGNATRVMDYIRMPHTVTYNMAFLKEFPLHEQVKLAIRAELYGALNHPYFQTNGSGSNFVVYQNLDYQHYTTPPVTAANINPAYADVGQNIGGIRTIQIGAKLYF